MAANSCVSSAATSEMEFTLVLLHAKDARYYIIRSHHKFRVHRLHIFCEDETTVIV